MFLQPRNLDKLSLSLVEFHVLEIDSPCRVSPVYTMFRVPTMVLYGLYQLGASFLSLAFFLHS